MKKILVSACLCGNKCRYKGDDCMNAKIAELGKGNIVIPVCAEQLGGLPTPRHPAERVGDKVISDYCVMKANSPSCGKGVIYDGTFTGNKTSGNGLTTERLLAAGFTVYTEDEI